MDFHGVRMQGQIHIDKETTLPVWTAADEGRFIYVEADDTFYYGTSAGWESSFSFKNIAVGGQSNVAADSASDVLTLAGAGGLTITTDAVTDTITFTLDDDNVQRVTTDSGTAVPASYILAILGGEGIVTSSTGNNVVTVTAEDASTSNKGIASFDASDFNVAAGVVTIDDTTIVHQDLSGAGTHTHAEIDTHIDDANDVHGVTGDVVGTTDIQTLTNKTLTQPDIADLTLATHDHGSNAKGGNILNVPTIADFTNATHDHGSDAKGGNTLNKPTIADYTNAGHDHSGLTKGGRTLNIPILVEPVIDSFVNATHDHTSTVEGGFLTQKPMMIKMVDDVCSIGLETDYFIFPIPLEYNGMKIYQVEAFVSTVSSSGRPTYTLTNLTDATAILSTAVSIDVGEYTSYTSSAPSVVDAANALVSTGDRISISKTVIGTGELGDTLIISFRPV